MPVVPFEEQREIDCHFRAKFLHPGSRHGGDGQAATGFRGGKIPWVFGDSCGCFQANQTRV